MFEGTVSLVPSIWASVNSWFTPAVLFVLLNLMIGTIAVTSGFGSRKPTKKQTKTDPQHPQLVRSPSVLHRLKSIHLYAYRSPEPPTSSTPVAAAVKSTPEIETHFDIKLTHEAEEREEGEDEEKEESFEPVEDESLLNGSYEQTHWDEEEEEEEDKEEEQSLDEVYGMIEGQRRHVRRVKSDTRPFSGEIPVRLPRKMKKSASAKSAFAHFEENDIVAVESRRPATVREGKPKEHIGEGADHEVDAKADDFINRFRQQLQLQRLDSIIRYKELLKRGNEK